MTQIVKFKLTNLKEINRRLSGLADNLQSRLLVRALKKAATPMMEQAKVNAPTGPQRQYKGISHGGFLKESFRVVNKGNRNPYMIEVQIQNTAYYALWVEYGHKIVKGRGKNAKVVGSARGFGYMRRAFDSGSAKLVSDLQNQIFVEFKKKKI